MATSPARRRELIQHRGFVGMLVWVIEHIIALYHRIGPGRRGDDMQAQRGGEHKQGRT